jgi:transmembrane sensor
MMDLDLKYRTSRLTPEELMAYRKEVNTMSDEQLESIMLKTWEGENIDVSKVEDFSFQKMKKNIDERIGFTSSHRLWIRVIQMAAAVLLPIFIISTLYLYKESSQLSSEEMKVSTGVGERANITLPDGTKVALNAESELTYVPKIYNKKERKIHFDGEGYFQVSKDKDRPFFIHAKGLQVMVLGTKFNLLVRKHEATAELTLDEGKVSFSSLLTKKSEILTPNQKAILDQNTGNITVIKLKDTQIVTSWMRKELIFRNEPLLSVIKTIEKNYKVKMRLKEGYYLSDLFTGTLTSSDINEDLEILEKSYHFKVVMDGETIVIIPGHQ